MPDSKITMTSSRPYLVRAFNEWILDNDCTPYIVVDAGVQGVQVPTEHVANGQIMLNNRPGAARGVVTGSFTHLTPHTSPHLELSTTR